MKFTKMQGNGNDYVFVDCTAGLIEHPEQTAMRVSDRHFGVGADGLVLISRGERADFRMTVYNADGSRAQVCGNSLRCVGKFLYEKGLTDQTELAVETDAGVKKLTLFPEEGRVTRVTVDLGAPMLRPAEIPVIAEGDTAVKLPVKVLGDCYEVSCVSVGNPHAVIFCEDAESLGMLELEKLGPQLEHHPYFPERTNVEFVTVRDRQCLILRVWERGAGETLASGTGACAAVVAAVLRGLCEREVTVCLAGGDLQIVWDEKDGHLHLTGPAEICFEGEYEV